MKKIFIGISIFIISMFINKMNVSAQNYNAGDLVGIKLNDTETDDFYIMKDNGDTVTAISKFSIDITFSKNSGDLVNSTDFESTKLYEILLDGDSTKEYKNITEIRPIKLEEISADVDKVPDVCKTKSYLCGDGIIDSPVIF